LALVGLDVTAYESDPGLPPQHNPEMWYEASLGAVGSSDVEHIVGEHLDNWVVWCDEVSTWDLRKGLLGPRLRLRLANGTHRQVMGRRIQNSFPAIHRALETALGTPQQA
jgi:hypothetical protein